MDRAVFKKKIIFIAPSLVGGGAEKVLIDILGFLDPDKYDLHLVLFEKKGVYLSGFPGHVQLHDLKKEGRYSFLKLIVRLAALLRKVRPDTAVSLLSYANLITVLAGLLAHKRIKIITGEHIHLSSDLSRTRLGGLKKVLIRMFYGFADLCVVPSEGIKKDLLDGFGLKEEKVRVIYNPVDLAAVARCQEEAGDIPSGRYILAVGRLTAQKDYPTLLKAYALVCGHAEVKLVILGQGAIEGELKNIAQGLGIAEKVLFLGFQKNPYKFMRHASLFVLSSQWESFALVIVEAMACGVPVVATDCPVGPREIIDDGVNGILVEPKNEKALAKAILGLLDNEELKRKLVSAGTIRAMDFDKTRIIPEYEKIL